MFHDKLTAAGMTQSMSRVGMRIDSGPYRGFLGYPQAGTLLWQAVHQPGTALRHDSGVYRLLQFLPPPAVPGHPYAYGSLRLMPSSLMEFCILFCCLLIGGSSYNDCSPFPDGKKAGQRKEKSLSGLPVRYSIIASTPRIGRRSRLLRSPLKA